MMYPQSTPSQVEGIRIEPATPAQADDLVRLIMTAMTADCCLYYAGPGRTLEDFARVLGRLVREGASQYSYRNTIVAIDIASGCVVGACVAYDGACLHALREAFFRACREEIGREFDAFADETGPGEYYVDSLAVRSDYRRRGIASALLRATALRAEALGLPLGLLVDQGNPGAERMYTALGFRRVGPGSWGGHPMWHLVWRNVQGK